MFLSSWFCVSMILCFPLFKNPVSMVGMVVGMSILLVSLISMFSSFWFSYVLFLVYVGGLLVLFIYICLISSNYPFKFSINGLIYSLLISILVCMSMKSPMDYKFLGYGTWVGGESLLESSNISIFLFLGILLLMMLLAIVRVSGSGCFDVSN
uniref:NADH dehydrogenase subunit 6 n=1 Tax=Hypselodoris apolegma TaxID=1174615 RepID=A0A343RAN3_9GAST|nr:NADH dehydrogenase subunit 6 [Hypselodoris apolegma]ATX68401.1 NADH dehydrogenase subunit 6 [Hypselodoris apolegma]